MDTGLLNHINENFFTSQYFDESIFDETTDFGMPHQEYDWEEEMGNNIDIELIPSSIMTSNFHSAFLDITESSPSVLLQQLSEGDLPRLLNVDVENSTIDHANEHQSINDFDLASYINSAESKQKYPKIGGKKIDLIAQKYIVENNSNKNSEKEEEEVIDVETINEDNNGNPPVLEAFDPISLLEKFEASENAASSINNSAIKNPLNLFEIGTTQKSPPNELFENGNGISFFSDNRVDFDCIPKNSNLDNVNNLPQISNKSKRLGKNSKNKQILESLPQDLIQRINESGKRKKITVIDPMPTKKRRVNELTQQNNIKLIKTKNEQINHDHNYCDKTVKLKEINKKDSGFQSSEDDEKNNVLKNQPLVKTQDGKLMVSLLKMNTINNNSKNNEQKKKKLNFEEYKRRRFIKIERNTSSNSSSCSSLENSNCSSPIPIQEDENLKIIKHQAKLMKMAQDLLKTIPNKSTNYGNKVKCELEIKYEPRKPRIIQTPSDLEVKTYINVGCNTDFSDLESLDQLEEIKPLLQKVSTKITSNSFINSLIQNIPKIQQMNNKTKKIQQEIVRENKTIYYLKKDRPIKKTNTVSCQTNITLISERKSRYRRRSDSSSSESSCSSRRNRRLSHRSHSASSSVSSVSTSSSSSYSSGSRSNIRKLSNDERLREVEERRVIYIGRILNGTSKDDLRKRFVRFGPITNISLHFRNYGDNYGFVTFANKEDAYEAVSHGNDGHTYPKYDLSFGGRRIFCKTSYSDLDDMKEEYYRTYTTPHVSEIPFDVLLKATQEKLRRRKP